MGKITSMHFAGWKMGLKTGMYYLRTMAASAPIQFTVDQEALKVEDSNVARSKKRVGGTVSSYSAVPRPNGAEAVIAPRQESPRTVIPEPVVAAPVPVEVVPATEAAPAEEAAEGDAPQGDIFSDAVLQCSIENKEACLMCQG